MSDPEPADLSAHAGWRQARRSRDPGNTAPPKMAEELAHRIETLVMSRDWPVGETLGSEPELIERFGVSRAVLREAVRILEHHGVARMRRGPGGGLVVTAPDSLSIQRPATLYLDYAGVSAPDLRSVRSTLEVSAVESATRSLDEQGVAQLREVLDREAEIGVDGLIAGPSDDFHVLVAKLSGNPALLLFVETLVGLTFERSLHRDFEDQQLQHFHDAHAHIVEAMLSRDTMLARQRMENHLADSLRYVGGRQDAREE
jgi:DNA-binding FadR family transcriptional regulator